MRGRNLHDKLGMWGCDQLSPLRERLSLYQCLISVSLLALFLFPAFWRGSKVLVESCQYQTLEFRGLSSHEYHPPMWTVVTVPLGGVNCQHAQKCLKGSFLTAQGLASYNWSTVQPSRVSMMQSISEAWQGVRTTAATATAAATISIIMMMMMIIAS